jgi:hypothetical protein
MMIARPCAQEHVRADRGSGARRSGSILATVFVWAMGSLWATMSFAQELSPRFFWPAPKGTKVAVVGYSYSSGDLLADPSLPVYGAESRIHTGFLAYMQTFSLLGRTTNFLVEVPYSWGTTQGLLSQQHARSDFSGFNDLGLTPAVNLVGAPSMTPADFLEYRANPGQILGASLKVLLPTGEYDDHRLINAGANRFSARAEAGYIVPITDRWLLELGGGARFFSADDDFLTGRREQNPIFSAETHLIRRLRPGFWASLEANFYTGGDQTIGRNQLIDLQKNSRIGETLVVPFLGRYSVKVGYSTNITASYGTDFDQFLVT